MNLLPFAVTWAVLATLVLALAIYRRTVASKEDDFLHVAVDVAPQQMAVAKKLEFIDRWGKILTIVVAVLGLALLAVFLYNGWANPPKVD